MADTPMRLFASTTTHNAGTQSSRLADLVKVVYEKPFLKALDQDTFIFQLFPRKNTDDFYVRWQTKVTSNTSTEFHAEDTALGDGYGTTGSTGSTAGDYVPADHVQAVSNMRLARNHVVFSDLVEGTPDTTWINQKADEIGAQLDDLRSGINDALIYYVDQGTTWDAIMPDTLTSVFGDGATDGYAGTTTNLGRDTIYGITRSSVAAFKALCDSGGQGVSRALTLAMMQKMFAKLTKPDRAADPRSMVLLATSAIADSYGDIHDARRRWDASSAKVDLAYGNLTYQNIPIVVPPRFHTVDTNIGAMYWVDKRSWNLYTLKPFFTEELPKTTAAPMTNTVIMGTWFNLVCKAPRQQGVIHGIASTY